MTRFNSGLVALAIIAISASSSLAQIPGIMGGGFGGSPLGRTLGGIALGRALGPGIGGAGGFGTPWGGIYGPSRYSTLRPPLGIYGSTPYVSRYGTGGMGNRYIGTTVPAGTTYGYTRPVAGYQAPAVSTAGFAPTTACCGTRTGHHSGRRHGLFHRHRGGGQRHGHHGCR